MNEQKKFSWEVLVWTASAAIFFGVLLWHGWRVFNKTPEAPAPHVQPQPDEKPVPPVPDLVKAKSEPGPFTFWSGEVIVGKGPHRGKLELLAHPKFKSVVLTADEEGKCWFDQIDGMKSGEMYIRLQKRGQAPLVCMPAINDAKEVRMWPVQQLTERAKAGKWGPKLMPHIDPPLQRLTSQEGQMFSGFTWSMQALPGKDPNVGSDVAFDIPQSPLLKANFEAVTIDLAKHYATEEQLAAMAEADKKWEQYSQENNQWSFSTSVGKFQIVSSCDRYSANPKAKHGGGFCFSTLLLPNGKVIRGAMGVSGFTEAEGSLFLVCRQTIFKWLPKEKVQCHVSFDQQFAEAERPYISHREEGMLLGRYIGVNKSSQSNFGGLLDYKDGKWNFHAYDGDYGSWVEDARQEGDRVVLTLWNKKQIRFEPKDGTFTDL